MSFTRLRISLQRLAQHDRQRFAIAETLFSRNSNDTPDFWLLTDHGSVTSRRVDDSCHPIAIRDLRGDAATAFQLLPAIPVFHRR
jgi:hypothetical protein